jgi:ribosomal protein S18 acetylase RimI-like enzyme
MQIRAGNPSDRPFLDEMLFEAFFWNAAVERPLLSRFREEAEFARIFDAWGRPGDRALIATSHDLRLGAAWFRLWTPELHSYGFVAADTPEIGVAVAAAHRSRGVGRALLRALIETAHADGHPALSLSVSPENPARRLYESEGFRKVGESGTSWTLSCSLRAPAQR